jgi:hypothetical protein
MSLSDIVSHMQLDVFPNLALVLFLAAFAMVLYKVARTTRAEADRQASIPLSDTPVEPRQTTDSGRVSL